MVVPILVFSYANTESVDLVFLVNNLVDRGLVMQQNIDCFLSEKKSKNILKNQFLILRNEIIAYHWLDTSDSTFNCFLMTTSMNKKLFYNSSCTLNFCAKTFRLQNDTLRCHQLCLWLKIFWQLILDIDVKLKFTIKKVLSEMQGMNYEEHLQLMLFGRM